MRGLEPPRHRGTEPPVREVMEEPQTAKPAVCVTGLLVISLCFHIHSGFVLREFEPQRHRGARPSDHGRVSEEGQGRPPLRWTFCTSPLFSYTFWLCSGDFENQRRPREACPPRKRGSGDPLPVQCIPAFAGMTAGARFSARRFVISLCFHIHSGFVLEILKINVCTWVPTPGLFDSSTS